MESHKLSFAEINILRHDIAEVKIYEGIEMDLLMVEQYHDFLLKHLIAPFALLINKVNSYTYSFPAQVALADLEEINAMAVVTYSNRAEVSTKYLTTIPRQQPWNLTLFSRRDKALLWLEQEQTKV